jgi:RNA 2',3'-cyclic 3'-phosphodiesterase
MTNEQLLLPGMDLRETASSIDNLFIAVLPDGDTAKRIKELGLEVGKLLGVRGKPRPIELLHLTLCHVGTYRDGLREGHVKVAMRICEEVAALSHLVELGFDKVATISGQEGRLPFVLSGGEGNSGLYTIRKLLLTGLLKQAVQSNNNKSFNPHVTMAYVKDSVDEVPIQPVRWTAGEILLIHSLAGKSEHRVLGRWPLLG